MDKAHLHASLHKLMDYLITHGYDQPINKKKLMAPSGRDFNNITGFLFRQLDPNYMVRSGESANRCVNLYICASSLLSVVHTFRQPRMAAGPDRQQRVLCCCTNTAGRVGRA